MHTFERLLGSACDIKLQVDMTTILGFDDNSIRLQHLVILQKPEAYHCVSHPQLQKTVQMAPHIVLIHTVKIRRIYNTKEPPPLSGSRKSNVSAMHLKYEIITK